MKGHSTTKSQRTKYRFRRGAKLPKHLECINQNAAGIDVGSREHYVCVPDDRDVQPVRTYGCYTPDLEAMAQWLGDCGIETVAMESTGVYWIPVYRVLEAHGFEVYLVNARHIKYVPGRKTDVLDCQWLHKLHTFGLLSGSFVPSHDVDALRTYWRQRKNLVQSASRQIQHMQKAMTQTNLHLHVVLSDIGGVTGMKIIRAIVNGERNPDKLAALRHPSVRKSAGEIANALTGHYRDEHIFALRQAVELYDVYQDKIADCDRQLQQRLSQLETKAGSCELKDAASKKNKRRRRKNEPYFDLRSEVHRITGVDLTQIPGIDAMTAFTVISECEIHAFPTAKQFASWLGLCPNNAITGGVVHRRSTKTVYNRIANALRVAAQSLHRSTSYLGAYYRRKRQRLGAPKAITATAHKLARLIYNMLTQGQDYVERSQEQEQREYQERRVHYFIKQLTGVGFEILNPETGEIITGPQHPENKESATPENKELTPCVS